MGHFHSAISQESDASRIPTSRTSVASCPIFLSTAAAERGTLASIRKCKRQIQVGRDDVVPGQPIHLRTSRPRGYPLWSGHIPVALPQGSCRQQGCLQRLTQARAYRE